MRYLSACAPLAALFVLATTTTTGCDVLSASEPDAPEVRVIEYPWSLEHDFELESLRKDSFRIDAASVDGDLLRLDVSYEGGCEDADHDFALYSSAHLTESNPPGAPTWLSHDAGGDTCTETVQEELTFDLSPLKKSFDWDETLIIGLDPYRTHDGPARWDQLRYER
jgi:hypothetical protein